MINKNYSIGNDDHLIEETPHTKLRVELQLNLSLRFFKMLMDKYMRSPSLINVIYIFISFIEYTLTQMM
jgi:hypothetical protein